MCVDQANIDDEIQCLPVFLKSCEKVSNEMLLTSTDIHVAQMLVLYGETYAKRLWCVWELYVHTALEENALQSTLVVPLSSRVTMDGGVYKLLVQESSGCQTLSELAEFSVSQAHCFSIKDETKIKTVIKAAGQGRCHAQI